MGKEVRSTKDYKQNEIQNVVAHNIAEASIATLIPSPKPGQFLYNVTKGLFMWYDAVHSKWTSGGVGALKSKGSLKASGPAMTGVLIDLPSTDVEIGDAYWVVEAGTYNSGTQNCTVGDWFFCSYADNDGTNPVWNYVPAGNGMAIFIFEYDAQSPTQSSWSFTNSLASTDLNVTAWRVYTDSSSGTAVTHCKIIDCDVDITASTILVDFGEAPIANESFKLCASIG